MSALSRAERAELRAYDAMVSAQADVIEHQLAGIENAETARRRARARAMVKQWESAARRFEDVNAREWAHQ